MLGDNAHEGFYDRGILSDYSPYIPDRYRDDIREIFSVYYRILYRCESDAQNTESVNEAEEIKARDLRKRMRNELKRRWFPRIDMRLPSWHN